ncbi:MAG: hypothetical protein PUI85_04890 [Eubacteriales bacterium]|nr:hypothetical protein [Eubacteriales bacterium]MDY3332436.1 hypothetical protein [Gallibacter sp.]
MLTIIDGGLKDKDNAEKQFVKAYAINTRLMGVYGLYIHWKVLNCVEDEDLHQFYYIEDEEPELSRYERIWGNDERRRKILDIATFGCLGGNKVAMTEDESIYIVQEYYEKLAKKKDVTKEELRENDFILSKKISNSDKVAKGVVRKIITSPRNDNELINYALMRLVCYDQVGMDLLYTKEAKLVAADQFVIKGNNTMYLNEIVPKKGYYLCETIIGSSDGYYAMLSRVEVEGKKVVYIDIYRIFRLTNQEVAMKLNRNEYITFYRMKGLLEDNIIVESIHFDLPLTSRIYPNGCMYMIFKKNNDHVMKSKFNLNDDIYGVCFVTIYGEIILVANNEKNAILLEEWFLKNVNSDNSTRFNMVGRYYFKQAVLLEFANSEQISFDQFLENIGSHNE